MHTSKRSPTLEGLARMEGPPLTTTEVARIIGMSPTFIRKEIKGGELRAVCIGRGRKRVYRIRINEALRYARQLGLLQTRIAG